MPLVNPHDFFFEAIQRLCGSLVPGNAIPSFYEHISRFLPLQSFSLLSCASHDHPDEVIVVAHASPQGVRCPMRKVALTAALSASIQRLGLSQPTGLREHCISAPNDYVEYLQFFFPDMSAPVFFLRLIKEDVLLGSAHFQGSRPFTEEEVQRMRGLEAPLCIAMGNLLQHRELEEIKSTVLCDNQRLRRELQGLNTVDAVGGDRGLKAVLQKVRQIAPVDVSVLVSGETGTGKELIARALHELSNRHAQPFVAVNCGALPPTLLDSELFGFTRGAFTGAAENHKGYFERADKGTLFLDEIGELPLEAQARLLRVLETHEVEKLGGKAPLKLDIRLVAATNRHLPAMVAAGTFRADLYFRLRVVEIALPPLRERREDIPELTSFLLQRSAARFGLALPKLGEGEMEALLAHSWPGNIRELQNILEEALLCSEGRPLRPAHFLKAPAGLEKLAEIPQLMPDPLNVNADPNCQKFPSYDELLRTYFTALLTHTKGRISGEKGAALKAQLKPGTFRFKCTQLGVLTQGKARP